MPTKRSIRSAAKWLWVHALRFSGALAWAERKISSESGVVVLAFHRVLPDSDFEESHSPHGMTLRSRTFERLIAFLAQHFDVIDLNRDFSGLEKRSQRLRIAVTFDDGWRDTASVAYPVTARYGVPITIFMCSGLAGESSPFWPEQITRTWRKAAESVEQSEAFSAACKKAFPESDFQPAMADRLDDLIARVKTLPSAERRLFAREVASLFGDNAFAVSQLEGTVSWDEARALQGKLCRFGSHAKSHEILTRLPLEEAARELADSKKEIEAQLGYSCTMLAYPNGSWSEEIREAAQRAGYAQAFVITPGVWTKNTDPWLIPRVNLWEGWVTNQAGEFSPTRFRYSVFWRGCGAGEFGR